MFPGGDASDVTKVTEGYSWTKIQAAGGLGAADQVLGCWSLDFKTGPYFIHTDS